MPSSMRITFNAGAIQSQVLRSPGVRSLVSSITSGIYARAGQGMAMSVSEGRDRVRGMVWTDTPEGRQREAKERALSRAVGR